MLVEVMDLEKTLPVEESRVSGGALSDNLADKKIVPADHPLVRLTFVWRFGADDRRNGRGQGNTGLSL